MGARNPSRVPRLASITRPIPGNVRIAVCRGCGHRDALPIDRLIKKFGPEFPIEEAAFWLKCSQCDADHKTEIQVARLCEPGVFEAAGVMRVTHGRVRTGRGLEGQAHRIPSALHPTLRNTRAKKLTGYEELGDPCNHCEPTVIHSSQGA